MHIEHLALDGSVVSVQADADLSRPTTRTGWAIVPSLMQSHPFTAHPQGYADMVEETVRDTMPDVEIDDVETFSLKNGELRVSRVTLPTATGPKRSLTVAAWEGEGGSLSTSLVGHSVNRMVEVFDTLSFRVRREGVVIDSPVVAQPRVPEVAQQIPGLGVIAIRPAVASELEQFPRSRGHVTRHGELFRFRAAGSALALVGRSAVARIDPFPDADPDELMHLGEDLRVEWIPREDM